MYTDKVTLQIHGKVKGPGGINLRAGQIAVLDDSPYVRVLIKSGSVSLIDPPSLDAEYLHSAGLLRKGEVYNPPAKEEPKTEEPKAEEIKAEEEVVLTRKPRLDVPKVEKKVEVSEKPEAKLEKAAELVSEYNAAQKAQDEE